MIRSRYRDSNELSPGSHAAAERHGRSTTVYLPSGLTTAQRRAALRRLRAVGPDGPLPAAACRAAGAGAARRPGSGSPSDRRAPSSACTRRASTVPVMVEHLRRGDRVPGPVPPSPSGSCTSRRPRPSRRPRVRRPWLGRRASPSHRMSRGQAAGLGVGPGQGPDSKQLTPAGIGQRYPRWPRRLPWPGRAAVARATVRVPAAGTAAGDQAAAGPAAGRPFSEGADPTPTSAAPQGAASTTPAAAPHPRPPPRRPRPPLSPRRARARAPGVLGPASPPWTWARWEFAWTHCLRATQNTLGLANGLTGPSEGAWS